jgi:ABC-type branched-subunit amino acid transport system substrate-binding protein
MTLAMMPLAAQHNVGIVVETSSSGKITDPKTPGSKVVSRISPTSELEALGVEPLLPQLGMKKIGYLAVNTDWGRGAVVAFGDVIKKQGGNVELVEYVGQADTDFLRAADQVQGRRRGLGGHHRRRAQDRQDAAADEGAGTQRQGARHRRLGVAGFDRAAGGRGGQRGRDVHQLLQPV